MLWDGNDLKHNCLNFSTIRTFFIFPTFLKNFLCQEFMFFCSIFYQKIFVLKIFGTLSYLVIRVFKIMYFFMEFTRSTYVKLPFLP